VPRSAHSLAEAAGESLRSIERQLARVGFQATVWSFCITLFRSTGSLVQLREQPSAHTCVAPSIGS